MRQHLKTLGLGALGFALCALVGYVGWSLYVYRAQHIALWAFANEAQCRVFPEKCQPPRPVAPAQQPTPSPTAKK